MHKGGNPRRLIECLNPDQIQRLSPGTREFTLNYGKDLQKVAENIKKGQQQMIEQANKHRKPSKFVVGDFVWVKSKEFLSEKGISSKLLPAYREPLEIMNPKAEKVAAMLLPPATQESTAAHRRGGGGEGGMGSKVEDASEAARWLGAGPSRSGNSSVVVVPSVGDAGGWTVDLTLGTNQVIPGQSGGRPSTHTSSMDGRKEGREAEELSKGDHWVEMGSWPKQSAGSSPSTVQVERAEPVVLPHLGMTRPSLSKSDVVRKTAERGNGGKANDGEIAANIAFTALRSVNEGQRSLPHRLPNNPVMLSSDTNLPTEQLNLYLKMLGPDGRLRLNSL
ncbi:hypothetical protein CBR_g34921 [Chara braunii]|uniref:Uncharacterized protein n=1 Tax=Chara braunii TaxID=69332 RepID=A0A388LJY5_CHABU|nr:hypothetical protein CBR_g34921 [Chara braunii]|eukprot:GBG82545.1 hypothetical protein CBR_g34921 [Chara braunii]